MSVRAYWHAYKYLPYEKDLSRREVISLFGAEPIDFSDGLCFEGSDGWQDVAIRTTYFSEVVSDDGVRVVPLQAALEASARNETRGSLPRSEDSSLSGRQSTRYSAHGLHEYKGKFNPQVVRAIGNILPLHPGSTILDPFCGSGTTLLEAFHIGWHAIAVDLNPLAVQITRAKLASMRIPIEDLKSHVAHVRNRLAGCVDRTSFRGAFSRHETEKIGGSDWRTSIPCFEYLCRWFNESVLVQIAAILEEIGGVESADTRLILRMILSDILRDVSLQDPDDLRIRRRKSPPENVPVIPRFLDDSEQRLGKILRARQHVNDLETMQDVILGDIRTCANDLLVHPLVIGNHGSFDGAITSPPYATALPYIDTQRLSLVLLSLIGADQIRSVERSLIGNREIGKRERTELERSLRTNEHGLPSRCISFCRSLLSYVDEETDGFRRQNVPALVYKYLTDMTLMFEQVNLLLDRGASYALVVGRNKTTLGGKTISIDTPNLLAELARNVGYEVRDSIELDTYQRYDIHQVQSIRSENLLILRSTAHGS